MALAVAAAEDGETMMMDAGTLTADGRVVMVVRVLMVEVVLAPPIVHPTAVGVGAPPA